MCRSFPLQDGGEFLIVDWPRMPWSCSKVTSASSPGSAREGRGRVHQGLLQGSPRATSCGASGVLPAARASAAGSRSDQGAAPRPGPRLWSRSSRPWPGPAGDDVVARAAVEDILFCRRRSERHRRCRSKSVSAPRAADQDVVAVFYSPFSVTFSAMPVNPDRARSIWAINSKSHQNVWDVDGDAEHSAARRIDAVAQVERLPHRVHTGAIGGGHRMQRLFRQRHSGRAGIFEKLRDAVFDLRTRGGDASSLGVLPGREYWGSPPQPARHGAPSALASSTARRLSSRASSRCAASAVNKPPRQ